MGFLTDPIDGGNIIREYIKLSNNKDLSGGHDIRMNDGQIWNWHNAIPISEFSCPKCGTKYTDNTSGLILGKEAKEVSSGYTGACLKCDEDFYIFELVPNLSNYVIEC